MVRNHNRRRLKVRILRTRRAPLVAPVLFAFGRVAAASMAAGGQFKHKNLLTSGGERRKERQTTGAIQFDCRRAGQKR